MHQSLKTNSSWLMYKLVKDLEIKTSALFNLVFAKNTILSRLFFFFLIIDLHFLIAAIIAQIFNPVTELLILVGIQTKK